MPKYAHSPVDGTRLAYDVLDAQGEAEGRMPVVLLHGSVLTRAIWRGAGYLEPLRAERPVVRVDLRGHGQSDRPTDPAGYAVESQVHDVLAVLDALELPRVHVMGYSLGARVGLGIAQLAPARIGALVALGGSASAQQGALDRVFFPGVVDYLHNGTMEGFCERQGLTAENPSPRAQATRRAFLQADPAAMAALFAATDATAALAPQDLASIPTPTLWMTGTRDQPRFSESQHAAGLMPHARFEELPGRTHGETLWPARDVLEHALPFLRGADHSPS